MPHVTVGNKVLRPVAQVHPLRFDARRVVHALRQHRGRRLVDLPQIRGQIGRVPDRRRHHLPAAHHKAVVHRERRPVLHVVLEDNLDRTVAYHTAVVRAKIPVLRQPLRRRALRQPEHPGLALHRPPHPPRVVRLVLVQELVVVQRLEQSLLRHPHVQIRVVQEILQVGLHLLLHHRRDRVLAPKLSLLLRRPNPHDRTVRPVLLQRPLPALSGTGRYVRVLRVVPARGDLRPRSFVPRVRQPSVVFRIVLRHLQPHIAVSILRDERHRREQTTVVKIGVHQSFSKTFNPVIGSWTQCIPYGATLEPSCSGLYLVRALPSRSSTESTHA